VIRASREQAPASADKPSRNTAGSRIGVFGGTFDPVHIGHLRVAEEFADAEGLDRVLFVPAARNPLRPGPPAAAAADRLAMLRLAVQGNPRFAVSDLELRRGGPSYTIDTLGELSREAPGARLVLALGADAWAGFGDWREPKRIAALADIVVLTRPGSPALDLPGDPLASPPSAVRAIEVTALDISASRIRALAAQGRSIRYLVPDRVLEFIESRGLYRPVPHKENE
jgi:nicotinate-nucleotide adenylyltransferase